jgi:mRNA interferase RelE/StbE
LTNIYRVVFRPKAQKRFEKLDFALRQQIARKLAERATNPRVPGDALSDMKNCYKIKLRASGIRLIYQVRDHELILLVIAVGARDGEQAYALATMELRKLDE